MSNERHPETERPHKQSSYESVRSPRESSSRKDYGWASDGETAKKSGGIFSEVKKAFTRSAASSSPTTKEYRRASGDERVLQETGGSKLRKKVEYDSDKTDSDLELPIARSTLSRPMGGREMPQQSSYEFSDRRRRDEDERERILEKEMKREAYSKKSSRDQEGRRWPELA
jgi:hypothetical protein